MPKGSNGIPTVAVSLESHIVPILSFITKRLKKIRLVYYITLSLLLLGFVNNKILLTFLLGGENLTYIFRDAR
jgi:hypothetical protein